MVLQGVGFLEFSVLLLVGFAWFAYSCVGFRVCQLLEAFSVQGISQGQLRFCRVKVFQCLEFFCFQDWLVLLTVGQYLVIFCVQRTFLVRVYLRVSYGFVFFRFFRFQSSFALRVCQVLPRLGSVQCFYAFRGLFSQGISQGQLRFFNVEVFQG